MSDQEHTKYQTQFIKPVKAAKGARPARMQPAYGGEPLPLAPIVLPKLEGVARMAKIATEYVAVLDKELAVDEDGIKKWNGSQRQYIRILRAKWFCRAMGQDAHYLKHGTFRRPFNAEPPGMSDLWQEQTRRREEEKTGVKVSTAEAKRKLQVGKGQHIEAIVKEMQKKYGTGTVKPPED